MKNSLVRLFGLMAVAFVTIGVTGCTPPENGNAGGEAAGGEAAAPAEKSPDEIFAAVQNGMTREQVVEIAGREPDNCVDQETTGLGTSSLCSYGPVSIMFLNGTVDNKMQL